MNIGYQCLIEIPVPAEERIEGRRRLAFIRIPVLQ